MQWFYVENNEQAGPVEDAEFARLQVQGLILDPTLVYCQGMADWMTLADARSQGFWTPPTTSAAAPPADAVPASSNPLAAAGFKPKMAESGGMIACPACGARVWENELIPMGDRFVCVHCRDVTLQKIREGVDPLSRNLRYAGFGTRWLGLFIDGIIAQIYLSILNFFFGLGFQEAYWESLETPMLITYLVLSFGVQTAYLAYFVGNPRFQATPGMMAVKIKAIRPDGSRITYLRALGRELASNISLIFLGLGFLMMLWDSENRTLHDRMADTRVIHR
ncbi:MAG: RDD family protein [Verrucomicrobia bacterium]|nr:RDD family protein [Verrucomicrobiota bacterium]MCH8526476.1 RDD family protein [Kiritimatiellia bacterium]